jgi:hypothetical protein
VYVSCSLYIGISYNSSQDVSGNNRLAGSEEVGAKTSDEPLDEDLEDSSGDEGVEESNGSVIDIPEATSADLDDEEDGEGDEECHQGGSPDRHDLIAHGVRELGVDNLAILEDNYSTLADTRCDMMKIVEHTGKATARCWVSHVDSKANGAHDSHSHDVEPSSLDPLSKARPGVVGRSGCSGRTSRPGPLLMVSSGRCSVCRDRCRVALVKETHRDV